MICINKNLNSYKILSNVFSEAEIAQLYIDNKYALPTDEESYQLVKAFSDKPTQIKEGVAELFESNRELANAVYEALGFETELPSTNNVIKTENKEVKNEKLIRRREIVLKEINKIEEFINNPQNDIPIYFAKDYEYAFDTRTYYDESNWKKDEGKFKEKNILKKPSYVHSHLDEELQKRIKNLQIINSSLYSDVEKVNYSNIFQEGKSYSSVEVLKYISENKQDVLNSIATTLLKYSEKNNVEIEIVKYEPKKPAGSYFYIKNKIVIYGNKKVTSHTLIHEIVHSLSSNYIENNPKSIHVLELKNILKNILDKKILKEYSNFETSYEDYATKDIHELLSEIISRPDILSHLSLYDTNYNLIKDAYKKETLLDKIVKILSDIFNFSKKEAETLSDLILFNAKDIFEASTLRSEFNRTLITPQQKQQAQQLYSQYLEQNPNGSVEQFKSWVEEFNRKTNIQGAYDFSASSNSGKWNSANNELLSLVQDNRKAFAIYKFLIGDMETFKEIVDFLNERGVEIPYTDRMKRADETMTAEERKSAIDSYNNSVDSKVEDKAQVEKDILSENNLQDETDYTPQELIEKYPLTGVQKVIWNLIKDIVNKLGIKVKFSSSRITEGFDGSNNPQNGEILIRPSTLKNGRFGEVLVHEIVHSLTTKIISRVNSGVTTGLTQKQINAVKGLMKLFKAIKADNNLENKYPVKDVFEFIAHLTNEKFVKELESKDKNFLQKVVDFILDIVGITNANELSKKYLLDIISDGVFLQENGVTVLPSDYGSNVQASLSDFITQKSQKRLNQIQDIFNENPELANAVYEAAGFVKPLVAFKDNFQKVEERLNDISDPFAENLGVSGLPFDYYSEVELDIDSLDLSLKDKKMFDVLYKETKTSDYLKSELTSVGKQKTPILINNKGQVVEGWHRINSLKANGIKTVKAYVPITPQQKQQAQQLYSQYLDTAKTNVILPTDRIVFGHPTIGKSFLKNQGEDKFISLDDDYATEINNKVKEIANKYNVTTYQVKDGGTQKWNNEYNQMMQEMFNVAKQRAISENKTLFTSNTNLLKNNAESFDKVINLTDKEFEKRIQERGAKYDIKEWKSQINQAISKIPVNKVINTDKYLSDLFLGSKQDIEGFKDFVSKESSVEDMPTTPVALSPKVLTELQESKLKEFIDKEDSFIKTIGVERTEQLVTYTFEKVVSSIEQGNGARAGFNSVLNVLQERLDELQEVSDNREEYELDEDYIQVLENTIKATKDTIDNFNVIVNRVNFELENTKGLVEDEDNSEDNGGDAKGERYNLEAYEIDPITGVSSKLKLFLSGIKAISPKAVSIARAQYKQRLMDENNELPEQDRKTEEEIDSIVNQLDENLLFDTIADESDLYDKTWFLQDALMPFRNVHKQLLVELAGVEESYEAVIAKLRQSAKEKYWINQVIDKLEKADTQTKNQFVSEMPKHNLSMEFVQLSKKYVEVNGKKISFYTTYVRKSNSNEVSQLVLENWKNDFISSDMVTPEVDDYVFNVDKVRELSEDMGNILSEVAAKPKVKILKGKVSTKEIFYKNLQNSISYAEEINVIRNSNAKPAVNIGTEGNVNTYIINEDGSLELYENDFGNLATKVQNLYKRVGISLSDNTVNYLIKNSTGTSYLDELSNVIDYISENIDARLFEDNTDPINQSSIKTLAALEARLNPNPNIMPTSFRTQGKDVFAFTAKNFLNDRAKALLTQELLNNLKRTPFAKDSKYIPIIERYLNGTASVQEVKVVEAMGIIEDLDLQVIKNLERVIAYGDKRFTRIDEIEQELVSLGLFVNSNTKPVDGKRIARYVFPTFSDKTRSAVVGMEAEEYSYDYENKTVTDETVDRVFKSTVEAELKRIINYHAKGHSTSNNEQYAMGGGLFFFFPTMNGIMIQTETGVENIHNAIKFQVTQMGEFNKGVKEYEETSLSEGIVEAIKQELKTQLNSQIDAKVDVWNEYELLKFVTENNVTSLKEAGFDYKYLTKFNKNNNFKNEADIERALRLFAADYKINDIVAKAEMHKLYLGDPAMMFKKSKNHSEIVKRMTLNDQLSAEDLLNLVKEAQTNIGKRLALEIATGKKSAENASKNYIQLMAKDPVVKSATLSYLSRVLDGKVFDLDNYAKLDDDGKKAYIAQFPNTSTFIDIDGADAQELTTLKEYLTTDIDFGKTDITLEEIDEILAIEEKDNITTEEFEKLSSFLNKITTQPQKPVYSGDMYDPDTETMRVVYIKTSAFPLSKHFTKDFQIDNLRKAMIKLEKETGLNVRMSYSTGNKLGAVTKANALTIFDNEGNVLSEEDIYDSINNEISIVDGVRKLTPRSFNQLPYLVLPRKNFRIQQENPLKRKSTIKGGSQERKLLWMDLLTLNNPEINKLYGEYMDLYESLYQEEFDKLMSEITTTNAEGEKVLSITKASELLLKEAKSRNYPIQDIRGLNIVKGNFAVPLMFHGSSERYESLINSIINNRLANIQMPGHSYILGSSEGFKVREVSEKYPIPAGTIFVKEGITDLKNSHFVELVKDENGNVIDRIPITKKIESYAKGEIEFVPAQVIVPNTIYVEIDGKKQKINLEEFVFTKDNKKYLDVSRFNPDLLKVFGFRIPTSGQMSMATMEIVGFMPENQGDLLLAPRDFTKQMGSDFDVDKLYTYNYEVEAYFDANGKPEYRKKDSKRNRIIEIHHNLLSLANTNVQRKVLSPLSFDIAKEQADLIENSKGYVPSILDDEYQKMKRIGGAAGKSGTGKYSLAITLHSSLQQAAFNRTKQEYIESELLQIGTYTQEGDFIPFRMTIAGLKFDGKLGKSNTLSLTGESSRDISDVLAQRQNYSLDNEKEQLMFRLNDNKYTMPFNMFMDLAGFDLVTVKDNNNGTVNISITDFLRTQPVILEYVKLRNLGKTEIEAFEELDKKYPFSEDFAFEAESASFAQQLFNGTANQSAVLNIFKSASEKGDKLGSLSNAYNTDSSGLGKSIFDVIDKENKIVNLYNSFYNIGNFNANTINGIVTNQALQASEMFEAIMPYRNLSFVLFNKVKAITGNDLNVDDMQDVFREFKKHIFASHLIKNFDDSAGSITDIRREMFFHTEENESFANYAKYVQQITPMALLNGMTFEINTNDLPSVITWNNSIKSDNETRFYTDFLAMFTNKTALRPYNGKPMTYQKFAQMLVTYAYLEGGIQGGYQYIKYVPVEYLQATGMAEALTNVQNYVKTVKPFDEDKIAEIVNDNFFVQLVQHNPSLVKNKINLSEFFGKVIGANAKEFKNVTEFSTKEKEKPRFFRVYNYQSDVKNRRIRKKEAEVLFIYDENTNKYYRIPSKGIYGMSEYDYMSNEIRSLVNAYNKNTVLDNNKALIEETKAESEFKLSKVSTVKDLLDFVSKSNNEYNRTIAQSLKGIADNVPVTIDNSIDSAGLATPNSIILRKDYMESLLKMNKFSEIEAVILEEVLHTVTIDYLRNPENHTEDIQRKVASIKKLYTKAFDKALEKKLFTLSEMEMIKKSYETAITPEQKVAYSLMDEYEFVARIISEPNTREALSKIKSGNKTYLERILDEISELINSVLKMLGISNDTITAEGIEATLDLVSAIKAQKVKDAKDTVEIRLQGKPIESKVPLSNTMSNFLNNYFTGEGESFFDNLTEEDKLSIATALARVYKDVNKMTFESIYDSDSAEEVFYYFATGKVLKEDVRNSSQFTKAVKEVKDYVNENQKFIDGYNKIASNPSISQKVKDEQKKEYDAILEKHNFLKNKVYSIEFDIRLKLLAKENYVPDFEYNFTSSLPIQPVVEETTDTTKSFTRVKPTIDLSREWRGDLESRPVYTTEGVNTMRTEVAKKNEHFGNPFSEAGYGDTIKVDSIGQAVQFYKDWLLYGELAFREKDGSKGTMSSRLIEKEPRRQWILNQINRGKLDGATLLYAGKLAARGKGSHAVSLAEVVEELRGKPTQFNSEEKIIKGEKVKEGIYVNQEALTKEEQLELFNYLKPYLESQAAKTNKSPNASKMIGLGLRWDYKSNNPNKSPIYIEDVINPANRTKYGYYNTSINGEDLAQITPRFRELFQKATNVDMTNYDAAIINLYDNDSFISTHNDVDESNSAINYPVIGINLGGSGNFSIESKENPMQLKLKAGTAYVFGVNGVNRKVFHRTFPGKQDSFLPELTTKLDNKTYPAGSYRVTITMRRVMPLTEGMTESPFKFTQPTTQETTSTTQPSIIISSDKYTRDSVEKDSESMYIFTDNAKRTSSPNATTENVNKDSWYYKKYKNLTDKPIHFGSLSNPTSAVIRGLNNAYPISTMSDYGTNWTDSNFELFKSTIDDEISQIKKDLGKFRNLKLGNYRIGQGGLKAKLPQKHQDYLDSKLLELGIDNTGEFPRIISTTQPTATESRVEEKIEIPKYEVNYNLQNKDGSKRFAQVSPEGVITINPVKNIQELFDYMEGKEGGVTSAQKKLVLDELSKQGYPMSKLKQIITTNKIANTFLILHEQDHIDNKDKDVYWLQGRDLNTPDKIAIETRATVNSLKKLEKMFPPKGNLPEGFEKIGSLSPIVKTKTVSVSGLPTIIVDENKQSRCK